MERKPQTFDLHVVANTMPPALKTELTSFGFDEKVVIGGDPRVRMQHLLSLRAGERSRANDLYKESVSVIERYSQFVGYIEQETIAHDLTIVGRGTAKAETFPEQFHVEDCPVGKYKKCDIHVAIPETQVDVTERLKEAGFYHLNLLKPNLGSVNIATIQTEDLMEGKRIWNLLATYLQNCGSFNGFAKFEITVAIKNFGFRLPPIVLSSQTSVA